MLLDALMLTPYIAVAASLFLVGAVAAVCWHFDRPAPVSGFELPRDRRRVKYRGAIRATRVQKLQEAA